ncbi:GHKL domain-containing protein [candidate division KSB1 bacterium]|nr:GHKL domain-containing protein [candidate division KSB1 bacterium]MBL7092725.1 GHKL domain-containing protein [candidate division KSB1 bacterium]
MRKKFTTKIVIIVIIALLAPLTSYTIFQFAEREKDEALIQSIYTQQLNSILFSVNQYCWDVFNSWVSEIQSVCKICKSMTENSAGIQAVLELMNNTPSITGIYIQKKQIEGFLAFRESGSGKRPNVKYEKERLKELIEKSSNELGRIVNHAQDGYIRPFITPWKLGDNREINLLLFPLINIKMEKEETPLAGIFIDNISFVNNIIARKFDEMDEGDFIFGVREMNTDEVIYSNSENNNIKFERDEKLWILPSLKLLIKIQGTTLDQISRTRTQRNLVYIVLVNFVLIFGLYYLIRNVYKEMRLAQMKTDFVANVSHELRTPLALIQMQAEMLEMGRVRTKEKRMHYYQTIMNESVRLTQLINNILDFSRIESHKKEFNLKPTDISALVTNTLEIYRFHIEQKGFVLQKKIAKDLLVIEIDEEAVKLAIVNLLDNAIKFTKDEKRIIISLNKQEKAVVVSIQDFGIGIPESEHKKIFDKFYRIGDSLVHNTKGSGLGLSLVKHIMEIHKGKVILKSKPGEGSTFSLIFPVA